MPMYGPQGREINLVHGRATTTEGFRWLRAWGQGWPLGSISNRLHFKKITKRFCIQMLMRTKKFFEGKSFSKICSQFGRI